MAGADAAPPVELRRALGKWDLTAIGVNQVIGSAIFLLFQIFRVSVVLYLPAICLAASTGLDVYLCILLMGGGVQQVHLHRLG